MVSAPRVLRVLLGSTLVTAIAAAPSAALADTGGECHFVSIDFVPTDGLQIVAWIEDSAGNYVDTAYITQAVGSYGIGNRPGRFDFNSGPLWPYGRRITTFPVWSTNHGMTFPEVEFQDGQDSDLSHPFDDSSHESHYCRPLLPSEFDGTTCATTVFTDKGTLSTTKTSHYPPRTDLTRDPGTDSVSVDQYPTLNPFDSVSQATPVGGADTTLTWTTPATVPDGNYVLMVEVGKEFDQNDTYSTTAYPSPSGISYGDYGEAYRGQPSIIYSVPFTLSPADSPDATTSDYAGYGDPNGLDGAVRPPDTTITTNVPGSGSLRLQLATDGTEMYRVRARAHVKHDNVLPDPVGDLQVALQPPDSELATFVAPGDDGMTGQITTYDIRISPGAPITDATFDSATRVPTPTQLVAPGDIQDVPLTGLLPDTDYSIAVKGVDNCHNEGPLVVASFHTGEPTGSVDACFVATAAYGSVMASDVSMLRHFRDAMLKHTVMGELFVESYYTFGPPVAQVVGESEVLRATARAVLTPVVARVKAFVF